MGPWSQARLLQLIQGFGANPSHWHRLRSAPREVWAGAPGEPSWHASGPLAFTHTCECRRSASLVPAVSEAHSVHEHCLFTPKGAETWSSTQSPREQDGIGFAPSSHPQLAEPSSPRLALASLLTTAKAVAWGLAAQCFGHEGLSQPRTNEVNKAVSRLALNKWVLFSRLVSGQTCVSRVADRLVSRLVDGLVDSV